MAATLDTLQIVKRLREAGFDEPQAEAVTGVFAICADADFSQLATKADKSAWRQRSKRDRSARQPHRFESAQLKAETIRWVSGIAVAQAALILGMLRLFPGHP